MSFPLNNMVISNVQGNQSIKSNTVGVKTTESNFDQLSLINNSQLENVSIAPENYQAYYLTSVPRFSFGDSASVVEIPNIAKIDNDDSSIVVYNKQEGKNIKTKPINLIQYQNVYNSCDKETKIKLESLKSSGILENANSNDGSSILENLNKLVTEPRIKGIDSKKVLKEVVSSIYDPATITQHLEDLPSSIEKELINNASNFAVKTQEDNPVNNKITKYTLNRPSSTCVAASIEFNLANKSPAEFVRMAADLTSEKMSTTRTISYTNLALNKEQAVELLDVFDVPYRFIDDKNLIITLQPDRNAIVRARVQNSYQDKGERSIIDILFQSTFMNIASQQTYNSLTDSNDSIFNQDKRGLTEIEKDLVESIVEDSNKVSVTYQQLDDDNKLVGYEFDFQNTKNHLINSINRGINVIVGITYFDKDKRVVNGHEITVIGYEYQDDGEITFICNDTDDNKDEYIKMKSSELIPKIHHAGIPIAALGSDLSLLMMPSSGVIQ